MSGAEGRREDHPCAGQRGLSPALQFLKMCPGGALWFRCRALI